MATKAQTQTLEQLLPDDWRARLARNAAGDYSREQLKAANAEAESQKAGIDKSAGLTQMRNAFAALRSADALFVDALNTRVLFDRNAEQARRLELEARYRAELERLNAAFEAGFRSFAGAYLPAGGLTSAPAPATALDAARLTAELTAAPQLTPFRFLSRCLEGAKAGDRFLTAHRLGLLQSYRAYKKSYTADALTDADALAHGEKPLDPDDVETVMLGCLANPSESAAEYAQDLAEGARSEWKFAVSLILNGNTSKPAIDPQYFATGSFPVLAPGAAGEKGRPDVA